jgi:hypothetical protein
VHYISKVLLEHYAAKEFAPKKRKTVAKKPQNTRKKVPKNG